MVGKKNKTEDGKKGTMEDEKKSPTKNKKSAESAINSASHDNTLNNEKLKEREKSELKSKPIALKVGNHYHYTLSSYEPVSVTVHVPSVGELDVEFMMENLAHMHNTTLAKIDDTWLQKNMDGIKNIDEFRRAMRAEAERLNAQYAEDQKTAAVVAELARRLEQQVPLDEISRYREQLLQAMQFDAQRQGTNLEQFLAQMGVSSANLDSILDDRAAKTAGQDAALSAYATHKKLKVPEEEIPALLQLPLEQATEVIEQARKSGHMDALEHDCKNIKASQLVVGEADVTYSHDTPEQTKQREEELKQMLQQIHAMDEAVVVQGGKEQGSQPDSKSSGGKGTGKKSAANAKNTGSNKGARTSKSTSGTSEKKADGDVKDSGFKIV